MQKSPSCSPPKERSRSSRKRRRSESSRSRRSRRSHRHSSRRHSSRSPRRRRSRRHRRSRRRSRSRGRSFGSNQTPTQVAGLQEMIAQAVQAAVSATAASISNLPTSQNANENAPVTKQAKQLLRGTIPSIKFVRLNFKRHECEQHLKFYSLLCAQNFCTSNHCCISLGFGEKLPKCHACQTLVSSIGIICWPKRSNCSSVETSEIQPPVDRSPRSARRMQENLRKFLAIRSQRAHYRKCARTRPNNKPGARKTTSRVVHHTATRTFSFLLASYARSPSGFCVHARLFRGQSRRTTNRTIIRRFHARWLHAQTLDASLHRSGAIQPWPRYQLRRKAKFNQIRFCERWHTHLFRCLSSAACTLQANATVRTARSVPLRQNSISPSSCEQRISRGLHASRKSYRGQVDDEIDQQSRENFSNRRARPQNRSFPSWHATGAHPQLVGKPGQTLRPTKADRGTTPTRQVIEQTARANGQGQTWDVPEGLVHHSQILHHSSRKRLSSQNQKRQFYTPSHGCEGSNARQNLPAMSTRMASGRTTRRPTLQPTTLTWQQRCIQNATISTTSVRCESAHGSCESMASCTPRANVDVQHSLIATSHPTCAATTNEATGTNANDGANANPSTAATAARANGSSVTTANHSYPIRNRPQPTLLGSILTTRASSSRQRYSSKSFRFIRFRSKTESISRFRGLNSRHRRRKAPLKQASVSAANTGLYKCYLGTSNGHRRVGAAQKRAMHYWSSKSCVLWYALRRYHEQNENRYLLHCHARVPDVRHRHC